MCLIVCESWMIIQTGRQMAGCHMSSVDGMTCTSHWFLDVVVVCVASASGPRLKWAVGRL
jgi:hypothetical protein